MVVTGKAQRRLSALLKAVALGAFGFGGNTTGPWQLCFSLPLTARGTRTLWPVVLWPSCVRHTAVISCRHSRPATVRMFP